MPTLAVARAASTDLRPMTGRPLVASGPVMLLTVILMLALAGRVALADQPFSRDSP